jgi:hypothetical protein
MKFTNILKSIILENSRFKVLYDSLVQQPSPEGKSKPDPKKIPFETLKALIFADPTTITPRFTDNESRMEFILTATVEDMEKVKVGKYTNWLIKNFMKPANIEANPEDLRAYAQAVKDYQSLFMEDLYKVTDDLKKYERFKNTFPQEKRDIAKLTKDQVFELVKDLSLDKTKASKAEKEQAKKSYEHPGANVVFRGSNWTVIKIEGTSELQKDAACFYGGSHESDKGESRWCTSSPGAEWWKRYLSKGPLYVILPNESSDLGKVSGLPVERYQFHFPEQQFMDRHDAQQNLVDLLNGKLKELKDFFKPEFANGLTSEGGDKVNINIQSGAAGKFIALYGIDEIIDNLKDSINILIIENPANGPEVALDIPASISRFNNLGTLMLTNIVRSLPDSIGDLKQLEFLSLPNNKGLKEIPASVSSLPNLTFVNVMDCDPNIKIPEGITKNFSDEGGGFWFRHE